jgi:hypothetical protein
MCLSRLKAIQPSLRFASGPHSLYSRVQASSARLVEPIAGSHPNRLHQLKSHRMGGFLIGGAAGIEPASGNAALMLDVSQ